MSTLCVLNVHKFVDEGCVHTDVYTNVYLLYTIFFSVLMFTNISEYDILSFNLL